MNRSFDTSNNSSDVAVTKHGQWVGEIWIIVTRTASTKSLFSRKFCHAIYILDTWRSPVSRAYACFICAHFIQHLPLMNACVIDIVFLWNNFPDFLYSSKFYPVDGGSSLQPHKGYYKSLLLNSLALKIITTSQTLFMKLWSKYEKNTKKNI